MQEKEADLVFLKRMTGKVARLVSTEQGEDEHNREQGQVGLSKRRVLTLFS
jgi:hypothetical protein